MEDLLEVGLIAKPQGVKGELKVFALGEDPLRLEKLKRVYIDGKAFNIEKIKFGAGFLIVSLFGVNDRNCAELFRGKYISALRADLPPLEEGMFYIVDLLGCDFFVGEKYFGKIEDIQSLKTDVITVKRTNGKTVRFPFLKSLCAEIDVLKKTMKVLEKPFTEIACYED